MAEKIQVVVDVNTESVTIATDRTLTLQQQLKVLKRELQTVPEGTQEWNLINAKFNDTKDALDRVNVKSRELFGTLQLIPGPIGTIASKVNGAIDLIKVFSSFKLTDIKASFKAFGQDINGVLEFLSNATGITKAYTVANNLLSRAFTAVGASSNVAAAGARALAVALTATGVLAIVAALALAVTALMNYNSAAKSSADAAEVFNDALQRQSELLERQLQDIDSVTKRKVLQAKIAGKSEEELFAIEKEGREKRLKSLRDDEQKLLDEFDAVSANAALSGEERNKLLDDILKKRKDASAKIYKEIEDIDIADLEERARIADKKRENEQKAIQKSQELQKKAIENQQKALAERIKVLDTEAKAEDSRLEKLKSVGLALAKNEQERLDVEKNFAKLAYDAKVADIDKRMKLYDKDSLEYKNLQIDKEKAETDYINKLGGFRQAQQQIVDEGNKARLEKEKEANEKAAEEREEFLQRQKESVEKEKEYFNSLQESTEAVTKNMADSFTQLQYSIGNALSSIGQLFEQGSTAQKIFGVLSVAVNAATAIGDIISRTGSSIAAYTKAAAESKAAIVSGTVALAAGNPKGAFQIKAGTAGVAAATKGIAAAKAGGVAQGIAVAAGAAGQIAAILSSKKSTPSPGPGPSGGGGGGGEVPAFSTPSVSAPQVGAGAAQQGTIANIVAGTIGANQSQTQPIRAYVVQNDIRTESQLDRRIRTAARLGG